VTADKQLLLTGATGFIGRHTAFALQEQGYKVRALCRSAAPDLESQGIEVVRGDVTSAHDVKNALMGVRYVVHGAGLVSRDRADTALMMRVHVQGTRIVIDEAVKAGVDRIVNLSTSGTVAVGKDPEMVFQEDDPPPLEVIHAWPYYRSKLLAERAAHDAKKHAEPPAGKSRPALITLNPTLALGPGDVRGSSTLDVRRFLRREVPVTPEGGLSFVDARDVAIAVCQALERGRDGERYLLSALNLTMEDFFARLENVSGVKGPARPAGGPSPLLGFGLKLVEKVAGKVGMSLPVSSVELEMASHYWYCDARKAEAELGWKPREPMQTLLDTVRDIRGESTAQIANAR